MSLKLLAALALPVYALDQGTKWWVLKSIEFQADPVAVIPDYFYLCHWANTGAAFGSFRDSNSAFVGLSVVAFAGLLVCYLRGAFTTAPGRWGVGLLLGGILGNVTDRILHGHVIDFLLVDLHVRFAHPWPAFNVADSAICIAAGLFLLDSFRSGKKPAA